MLLFFLSNTALAQNTKGDKPVRNQRQVRETKSKSVKRKEKGKTKDIAGRRLRTKEKSSASRANSSYPQPSPYTGRRKSTSDKSSRPRGRVFNNSPRESRTRAWTGDISGHKIRTVKPSKSGEARHNVYPQKGPYVNNPSKNPHKSDSRKIIGRTANGKRIINRSPQQKQKAWKGSLKGGPIGTASATGSVPNVYPQKNQYSRYTGKVLKRKDRPYSNAGIAGRNLRLSSEPGPRGRKLSVFPRSVSSLFVKRGKRNVYWGKYSKGERPFLKDLSGNPIRGRNFHSLPAGLVGRDTLKNFGRKPGGDRAFKGKARGFVSITPSIQRGWRGDLAGRKIRSPRKGHTSEEAGQFLFPRKLSISAKSHRVSKFTPNGGGSISGRRRDNRPISTRAPGIGASGISKGLARTKGIKPVKGGGSISGGWNNKGRPIDPRSPGQSSIRAGRFAGNIKGRRPEKGGGSISGSWNNNGQPIDARSPGQSSIRAGRFAGNIKGKRPEKGGGSISGSWNNNGQPIDARSPGQSSIRAGRFAGNIKGQRPEKGGGSVSGRLWNNKGQAIDPREPGEGSIRAGRFTGNIRAKRPEKGGGSISGKLWNNKGQAIDPREPGEGSIRAGRFTGNMKGKRPEKGGGSISGKLWNNNEKPIEVRTPLADDAKAAGYAGKMKLKRKYIQNENAHDKSNLKQKPNENAYLVNGFQIKVKRNSFSKKPEAHKDAMKGESPDDNAYLASGLQVKVRRGKYEKKPKAHEDALLGISPDEGTERASKYGGNLKLSRNYRHNPASHKEALDGRPPTKSSVKASEYSSSIKIYWNYKHNPSSHDDAMKVRAPKSDWERATTFAGRTRLTKSYRHNPHSAEEALKGLAPGRAYAKIGNYQGNIKMHKFNDRRLHPDAQFAHTYRDNVKGERTILMDVKLLWAKLFKKSDTQPENLKDNPRKPRYDKGEKGMWAGDTNYQKSKVKE
jgi:hypothetical protein